MRLCVTVFVPILMNYFLHLQMMNERSKYVFLSILDYISLYFALQINFFIERILNMMTFTRSSN